MSAHRTQEFRETCAICRALSSGECARCGRPLCDRHGHGGDERCAHCERDFRAHLERVGPGRAALAVDHRQLVSAFVAGVGGFLALMLLVPPGVLSFGTAFLGWLGVGLIAIVNHRRLRKKSARLRAAVERRERVKFLEGRAPLMLSPGETPVER